MTQTLSVDAANQTIVDPQVYGLPTSVPANSAVSSKLVIVQGFTKVAAGLRSSQAGVLTIQRFIDDGGLVRVGDPLTVNLVPGESDSVTANDGQVFSSFQITVANSSNQNAMLDSATVVVATDPATPDGVYASTYDTATHTTVTPATAAPGTIVLAPNSTAKYRFLRAPKTNLGAVWVSFGETAVSGQGIADMQPGDTLEMSVQLGNLYQGLIMAVADAVAEGEAPSIILVTEGV